LNASTRSLFLQFIAELKECCSSAKPTRTHHFLKSVAKEGRLTRWYTQNIDCLEEGIGLSCWTATKPKSSQTPTACPLKSTSVVTLHGTLSQVVCTQCRAVFDFGVDHLQLFKKGEEPACPSCADAAAAREALGRRRLRNGFLRPDIVLYNEPHPHGDTISDFIQSDISRQPTLLLVMGTSLKVAGLKRMIKDFVKNMKGRVGGAENTLVLYVNKTPAPRAEWQGVFDFELVGECDKWIEVLGETYARCTKTKKTATMAEQSIVLDPKALMAGETPALLAKKTGIPQSPKLPVAFLPSSPLGHPKRDRLTGKRKEPPVSPVSSVSPTRTPPFNISLHPSGVSLGSPKAAVAATVPKAVRSKTATRGLPSTVLDTAVIAPPETTPLVSSKYRQSPSPALRINDFFHSVKFSSILSAGKGAIDKKTKNASTGAEKDEEPAHDHAVMPNLVI
jgi:NAD-dependent histone deacetylase SIR2